MPGLNWGHPYFAVDGIVKNWNTVPSQGWLLVDVLGRYALMHGMIALACLGIAASGLRRYALPPPVVPPPAAKVHRLGWRRPPVGDLAMLWKEFYTHRLWSNSKLSLFLRVLFYAGGTIICLAVLCYSVRMAIDQWQLPEHEEGFRLSIVALVLLMLLTVALNAADRISREREQETLDSLWTTQLDRNNILYPKWLASVAAARPFVVFLVCLVFADWLAGGIELICAIFVLVAAAIYAAFAASLGLWLSFRCRNSFRATIAVIVIGLALTFGFEFFFANFAGLFMEVFSPFDEFWLAFRYSVSPMTHMSAIVAPKISFVANMPWQWHVRYYGGPQVLWRFASICCGLLMYAGAAWWLWLMTYRGFSLEKEAARAEKRHRDRIARELDEIEPREVAEAV
jgi:hypothetical protein